MQTCVYACELRFAGPAFDSLFGCMVDNGCFSHAASKCVKPRTSVLGMGPVQLEGSWWIVRGRSAAYDCFSCQHMRFYPTQKGWMYEPHFTLDSIVPDASRVAAVSVEETVEGDATGVLSLQYTEHSLRHNETWHIASQYGDWLLVVYCGQTALLDYQGGFTMVCHPTLTPPPAPLSPTTISA